MNDYSKTAVMARVFAVKKVELLHSIFSWPNARWFKEEIFHTHKISAYKIYSSFEQFGAVKRIRFFGETDLFFTYCWVYVEFYESQSVDAALLERNIKIGNDVLEIRKVKRTFCNFGNVKAKIAIEKMLLQAPNENSPKNFVNILNDDCLMEIFKHLSFQDQCSVLGVCVRFNRISKQLLLKVAAKQQQILTTTHLMQILSSLQLQQANDYLRILGSSIHTLALQSSFLFQNDHESLDILPYTRDYHSHIFMGMISKHCKNIRTLYIGLHCDSYLNVQMFSELIPLFARVENLFIRSSGRYLDSLLPICSQLRVLTMKLMHLFSTYSLPSVKLPKLVAFEVIIYDPLDESSLKIFLSLNTQIEAFSIASKKLPLYDCDSGKFDSVLGQLKHLKFLELDLLKRYEPQSITSSIQELLSNNLQIEHLKLKHGIKIDDEFIENISQMKSIQKLEFHFVHGIEKRHLISLALKSPNLKAMINFSKKKGIHLILFDRNIQQIVKELQEKMSTVLVTLDVQLLKNTIYEHMVETSTIPLVDIDEHYYWLSITSKRSTTVQLEIFRSPFSAISDSNNTIFPIMGVNCYGRLLS